MTLLARYSWVHKIAAVNQMSTAAVPLSLNR